MKGTVRQRTWERHEQVVRLHLGPTLGGIRLDRLNALQVQRSTAASSKTVSRRAR